MVVLADKEKKRLAEKHTKLLSELVRQPENSKCADCNANGKFQTLRISLNKLGGR